MVSWYHYSDGESMHREDNHATLLVDDDGADCWGTRTWSCEKGKGEKKEGIYWGCWVAEHLNIS